MGEVANTRVLKTAVHSGRAILAEPPSLWSYSSLREVETCALRFSLSRAEFPDLWSRRGYPRLPIPATIRGNVIHGSLEIIVRALVKRGCTSAHSADAVDVLRDLGGFTAIARGVLDRELMRFDDNPRLGEERRKYLFRTLSEWLPEARQQVQTFLHRIRLQPKQSTASAGTSFGSRGRHPVGLGSHTEKELIAENMRLSGRVDLLDVGAEGVTITDFKTGRANANHQEQLFVYALLWNFDSVANPDNRPLTNLVVSYPEREVKVAVPNQSELDSLRNELVSRIETAHAQVEEGSPVASPGDYCANCHVRGLCDTYWAEEALDTAETAEGEWYDITGKVIREHGVKSFVLREAKTGSDVLIRTPTTTFRLPVGDEVRILGARRVVDPDEERTLIADLSHSSEVLELDA